MKENMGPEILAGILDLYKQAEEAPWAVKRHDLPKGKWRRVIDPDEDVKADESEMVVLEHGNHFSVISLETFEVKMKVTLPRTFLATDVYCTYSEDDTKLIVPISKYDNKKSRYVYYRCEYETTNYTLVGQTEITMDEVDWWNDSK